jgi:hypothetical protein
MSLCIPCADKLDDLDGGGTLFVMVRVVTKPEGEATGSRFEALACNRGEDGVRGILDFLTNWAHISGDLTIKKWMVLGRNGVDGK